MDIFPWVKILQQVGPLITVIIFFVWRDYRREIHQQEKMSTLEKYQRDVLESLISQTTKALAQSSECIRWLSLVIDKFIRSYPRLNNDENLIRQKPEGFHE